MQPSANPAPAAPQAPEQSRVAVQHRCHPRAVDIAHTFTSLSWLDLPTRVGLWWRCYKSEPGFEPTEAFLVDPKTQKLRFKDERVIQEKVDRALLERQQQQMQKQEKK